MTDPIDPIEIPETVVDGVGAVKTIESLVRIPFFARMNGESIVRARLAIPVSELPDVIQALVIALKDAVIAATKPITH